MVSDTLCHCWLLTVVAAGFGFSASAAAAQEHFPAKGGQAGAVIVVGEDGETFERWMVGELQRYLRELSGAELPIVSEDQMPRDKSLISQGGPNGNPLAASAQAKPVYSTGPDADADSVGGRSRIRFADYQVFFDGQKQGQAASSAAAVFQDGVYTLLFSRATDATSGIRPRISHTSTPGAGWSEPEVFGPDVIKNPGKEFLGLGMFGPTSRGTMLCVGIHVDHSQPGVSVPVWRPGALIVGRRGVTDDEFAYSSYESGSFLAEQFVSTGISLASGRIVLPVWGAMQRGDNWQCGVLLSDDDGRSWRYRTVGYASDKGIRANPNIPAGYNEQTLFETRDGKVVSLIRGREKLGQVAGSPADTWFFRSESEDGGETWSEPAATDIAGTGASSNGITLPDGSLLHACRIPYSRKLYDLPQTNLYGLHIARSFDDGKTWETAWMAQQCPEGTPFDNYYNAMNGRFIRVNDMEWLYVFGQFDVKRNIHRALSLRLVGKAPD